MSHTHHSHTDEKACLMQRASKVTLIGVITLIIIKIIAWGYTDSISLLSSMLDSVMDLMASLVNFIAIRYAVQPADDAHRFGHGKAEYIAGLAQAMFISAAALFIFIEGFERIITPAEVTHGTIGVIVMLVSVFITSGIVWYQHKIINKTNSTAVKADLVHYSMDILANVAVLIAIPLSIYTQAFWIDAILALIIAAYILKGAWEVAHTSFQNLMDHEMEDEDRQKIINLVKDHEGILGYHKLKTRHSGIHSFIQMHVEMQGTLTLHTAHDYVDALEAKIEAAFPGAEVIIHMDPVS